MVAQIFHHIYSCRSRKEVYRGYGGVWGDTSIRLLRHFLRYLYIYKYE